MPNGAGDFASLLGRVRGRAGRGRDVGRARVTGAAYEDLENIYAGGEAAEERMGDLDVREANRAKRMGRYGDVGRVLGAIAGTFTGDPVKAAGAYAGGGRVGAEIGEHYAITPGKLLEGIWPGGKPWEPGKVVQKRAPAGQVPTFDEPVLFHKSKKAQLNKRISDLNTFIKRTQKDMNTAQWANAFTDFLGHIQTSLAINPQMRESLQAWKDNKGDFMSIFSPEDSRAPGSSIIEKFFGSDKGRLKGGHDVGGGYSAT